MVSIIPNRTIVRGEIQWIEIPDVPDDFWVIQLKVVERKKHKNYPDLMQLPDSHELKIKIHADVAARLGLQQGDEISGWVKAAGPKGYFFDAESVQKVKG